MATRLYGIVWRWHFLAGLAACPVLVVIALTGALYAFAPELEVALDREVRTTPITAGPARLDAAVAAAAAITPPCAPTWITVHADRARTAEVFCADGRTAYVDPRRAEVRGTRRGGSRFLRGVFDLHWALMLGERGRLIIEWATSIAVLLFLSGAYLWWPRRRAVGRFWPRGGTSGRARLRDLHAVAGAYAVPVLLAIAATGLGWTRLAGEDRWHRLLEPAPAPPTSVPRPDMARIGLDAAVAAAGMTGTERELGLALPSAVDAAYAVRLWSADNGTPSAVRIIYVDAYRGGRLGERGWDDRSMLAKLDASSYPIHTGALLGWPGRIAVTLAALTLALLCVTGPWMWWRRRPAGRLGVPPPARRWSWPLLAAVAALGLALPALGWTLLVIALLELARLAVRHLRSTATP